VTPAGAWVVAAGLGAGGDEVRVGVFDGPVVGWPPVVAPDVGRREWLGRGLADVVRAPLGVGLGPAVQVPSSVTTSAWVMGRADGEVMALRTTVTAPSPLATAATVNTVHSAAVVVGLTCPLWRNVGSWCTRETTKQRLRPGQGCHAHGPHGPAAQGVPALGGYRVLVTHILVVEDDANIRSAVLRALGDRGHAVSSAPDAMTGLRAAVDTEPDLVVLDLGLPDLDGIELLRMLRAVSSVPVIVATARDEDTAVVKALDAGADDYVVKPYSAAQLDARIRAVLRRSAAADDEDPVLVVGGLQVDTRSRTVTLDDRLLELSPREFDLLAYLAASPGRVVSKRELLTEVWRLPYGGADKTVDVHLSWLRRKLGETAQEPRFLVTVRGVGVKLVAQDEA